MEFYERIKYLAKEKGFSVCSLCKSAGVPTSVLYDIKSGRKQGLSRSTAEKIAAVLNVSVDELYGKEKAPDAEASEAEFQEAINLLKQLSETERQNAIDYLKFLSSKQ